MRLPFHFFRIGPAINQAVTAALSAVRRFVARDRTDRLRLLNHTQEAAKVQEAPNAQEATKVPEAANVQEAANASGVTAAQGIATVEATLLGIAEIANLAKVSKQTVSNWRLRYDSFPRPAQDSQSGPMWERDTIEAWIKSRPSEKTHVLSVINLKGGVGKTTTAVAVAEMLACEYHKHVLLIDLDPQTNATVSLIDEKRWSELDDAGRTIAQLFDDRLNPHNPPRFDIESSIVKSVSTVNDGIAGLDLLPSSIRLIEIQDRLPFIAMQGNFKTNPQEILRQALEPVMERYDYIIIDCPPSLGTVTRNGLRISTGYIIPTIPDIVSTWGIYQIVQNVSAFARDVERPIPPLGIVATLVRPNSLHQRVIEDLANRRLGRFGAGTDIPQPPLFQSQIPQTVAVARGADVSLKLRTLKTKYGEAYTSLHNLTEEIMQLCEKPTP